MPENSSPELIHAVPVRHWGRWISAAVVAVIAYAILNQLIVNPQFQWDVVWANLFKIQIVKAVGWTLALTVAAMVLGIILAVTMAIMRRSENPVLRSVATAYIWFFRGTPIYTQLIFWGLIEPSSLQSLLESQASLISSPSPQTPSLRNVNTPCSSSRYSG